MLKNMYRSKKQKELIITCSILLPITLRDSAHEANKNCLSGSGFIGSIRFLKRIITASIIKVIRKGGLPNFRTVAISAALIV